MVQDAFVQAWRGLARLRDPDRFVPWLHRIVANRARTVRRSSHRVREIGLDLVAEGAIPSTGDVFGAAEARAMIEGAFRRLSIDQRTLIGLHYASGLSITDVAAVLEIPVGTTKSRLATALAALRASVGGVSP